MFVEDDRAANNRVQEAESVIKDSSEADIIFVVHSLIEQNSELASKLEETSYLAKVAQEQIAESVRQRDMHRMEAARIMAEAQQLADKKFKEKVLLAEQEAKEIIKSAEAKAEAIRRLAEQEAKIIIDEAKQITNKDRHAAQENKNAAEVETKTAEVVALGESSDKVLTEEDKEQPRQRYIWDSTKLAWVENTKPVEVKPQMRQPVMKNVKANVPFAAGAGGKEAASNDEVPTLCHGNVNLWVISPSGMAQLHKFSNDLGHLKHIHQIRISKINVPYSQSICFELFLQRPIPLLEILKALPEVDTVSNFLKNSPESYRARQIRSQVDTRLVEVKLKQ